MFVIGLIVGIILGVVLGVVFYTSFVLKITGITRQEARDMGNLFLEANNNRASNLLLVKDGVTMDMVTLEEK